MNKPTGRPKNTTAIIQHFFHYLPRWISIDYKVKPGRDRCSYRIVRTGRPSRADDYTIIRKSRHSWYMMYFDEPTKISDMARFDALYELFRYMDELREQKEQREENYYESLEHEKEQKKLDYMREYQRKRGF